MHAKQALLLIALSLLAAASRADYVADSGDVDAMRARIQKSPPTSETLSAPLYPGARLDPQCSAEQSADQQGSPMVYCMYTKDPVDKVQAFVQGDGKPASGVNVYVDRGDVVNAQNYVTVSDVTILRYYVPKVKKPVGAPAAASPGATAGSSAPVAPTDTGVASAQAAGTETPAAEEPKKKKKKKEKDGAEEASDAVDAVNKLKGLFSH